MRLRTLLALGCCITAFAQVTVDESATRAKLVNNSTSVALAIRNQAAKPVAMRIELEWLEPDGARHAQAQFPFVAPPGSSAAEWALPLDGKGDPLLYRLHYSVFPDVKNLTAFAPSYGMISFPRIAEHAFRLSAAGIGVPRQGKPYEWRVFALHPVTHKPIAGVQIKLDQETATTGPDGQAILRIIPDQQDWDAPGEITFTGRLGDLERETEAWRPGLAPNYVRIYTDKPLYQPGQTLHVRLLAFGPDRRAQSGAQYNIEIRDHEYAVVYSAGVTTSQFGVAHTDWEIPDNAANGTYRIEVSDDKTDRTHRSSVEIRRYELPSFRVTVRPDRSFYLPGQNASVEVRADYLFGKPVSAGTVRICEGESESAVREGPLQAVGSFRTTLDLSSDGLEDSRFVDRHFVAYVTDGGTNRTEKRQFDLRLSREPLHVYVLNKTRYASWLPLFVSAYTPDGKPAICDVEVLAENRLLGTGKTNRLGLARVILPPGTDGEVTVRARRAPAETGETTETLDAGPEVRIETDQTLYRAGQPIRCRVTSTAKDLETLLVAWNQSGDLLFSRALKLEDGSAEASIPYDRRIGRVLSLEVRSGRGRAYQAGRAVLYPGAAELRIVAVPVKERYAPGDEATVAVNTTAGSGPVQSALGVAVVDESVFERAEADKSIRRHGWFDIDAGIGDGTWIAGVDLRDLLNLDPAAIDSDWQLVAEARVGNTTVPTSDGEAFLDLQRRKFERAAAQDLAPCRRILDDRYRDTLDYPRDESSLAWVLPVKPIQDAWLRSYRPEFTVEGARHVLRFVSGGPDKTFGTEDDFVGLEVSRPWFAPATALIREALRRPVDYPATAAEVDAVLAEAGLRLDRFRDPWGNPMRATIRHSQDQRIVTIESPGPDHAFGSADDVEVAEFAGSYFRAMEVKLSRALDATPQFPTGRAQLDAALAAAGIDLGTERDPWGQPYYATFRREATYTDRYQVYTYAEYQGIAEERKQVIPTKRRFAVIEIRSSGEDRIANTDDDFVLTQFARVIAEDQPPAQPSPGPLPANLGGRGIITGIVTDTTGAAVPGAEVKLDGRYVTKTDNEGRYSFRGLPDGRYRVWVSSSGFRVSVVGSIPVAAGAVTRVDVALEVGSVSEAIEVSASVYPLSTAAASIVAVKETSTPRLREYFPETLYWAPEVITDAAGHATLKFKLADSITTWRVALIGSTEDGHEAETSTAIRAFQPFFVDLDPPRVLTVTDEISLPVPVRNYLGGAQAVAVDVTAPPALGVSTAPKHRETIAANASANVMVGLRAAAAASGARLRVTARAKAGADAIEKPVAIHPDGEPIARSVSDLVKDGRVLRLDVPADAIPGSVRAEVKVYPDLLAHVIESMESLLRLPSGCAEQTISSSYPNLLFLRALKTSGLQEPKLEQRARRNLEVGYRRLLGYRNDQGAFGYWAHSSADLAVTAYAIAFLEDASELIAVDRAVIDDARAYLSKQSPEDRGAHAMTLRALAHAGPKFEAAVVKQLGALARSAAEFEDPYGLATFALAAMEAGRAELAAPAIERLRTLARDEQGMVSWSLQRNTPYHGWGRAGVIESTALAVSALSEWQKQKGRDPVLAALVDRGAAFLIRNKDARGTWLTGQATVRVFDALLRALAGPANAQPSDIDIRVNGVVAGHVTAPRNPGLRGPSVVDVSGLIKPGTANEVSLVSSAAQSAAQVQFAAEWYQPWREPRTSPEFSLNLKYSATEAAANDAIRCDVAVSRKAFRGYGMMIAEIGLPPGAEVDRATLTGLLESAPGVNSFEVAPDRVTFYVWPQAEDTKFSFTFRPRYAMRARTAPSALYDYYNPEARVVLPPATFTVK